MMHIAIFAAQGANKTKRFRRPRIIFATTENELQSVDDRPIEFEFETTMPSVSESHNFISTSKRTHSQSIKIHLSAFVVNLGTRCKASVAVNFVPTTIYNSNLHLIASRLKELGFELNILGKLPDDAEEHAKKILMHQNETDLLCDVDDERSFARKICCEFDCARGRRNQY